MKKTQYPMLGTLALGAFLNSCTVSQEQADAYNQLVEIAGLLVTESDATKLSSTDLLIQSLVTVEEADTK